MKLLRLTAALVLAAWLAAVPPGISDAQVGSGSIPFTYDSTASTNSVLVAAGSHTVYTVTALDTGSAQNWLLLFDSASNGPTCTGSPIQKWPIPFVSSTGNQTGGFVNPVSVGFGVRSGLGFCITSGKTGTGNATATVTVNLTYR